MRISGGFALAGVGLDKERGRRIAVGGLRLRGLCSCCRRENKEQGRKIAVGIGVEGLYSGRPNCHRLGG